MQRELADGLLVDLAYVGNRADGLLLFANYNQAAPEQRRRDDPAAGAPPDSRVRRHHLLVQRRQVALPRLPGQARLARVGGSSRCCSSLTLSQTKDNGAGSLENPNGNFPAPQDFRNMDADFGLSGYHQPYNSTTSLVWDLPFGRGRALHERRAARARRAARRLAGGRRQHASYAGDPVTLTYTPGPAFQVSGIQQDFRGANNYRPNVTGDVLRAERQHRRTT